MLSQDEKTTIAIVGGVLILVVFLLVGAGAFIFLFLYQEDRESVSATPPSVAPLNDPTLAKLDVAVPADPDGAAALTVLVTAAPDGGAERFVVKTTDAETTVRSIPALTRHLRLLRPTLPGSVPLTLQVKGTLDGEVVGLVRDACEDAGFSRPDAVPVLDKAAQNP
jgi:hypothetical protein